MLLKISFAFLALAALANLAKPFVKYDPGDRRSRILYALSLICMAAAIYTTTLSIEMNWIANVHRSISQTIALINKGYAENARPIWLDHVTDELSQRTTLLPVEFATLVLAGGSVGFRLGRMWPNKPAQGPSSTQATSVTLKPLGQ